MANGGVSRGYDEILWSLASGREPEQPFRADAGLIELAQRHGLIGALYQFVDSPIVSAIHHRQVARGNIMRKHMDEVLRVLAEEGIRATAIKGPAIADVYEDPSIRQFSDIDLLVEATRLNDVLDLLEGHEAVREIPPKRPKADKRDVVMDDPSGMKFNLDLHWDLFSYSQLRGFARGATAEAWDLARTVSGSSGPVWELPTPHRLAFLCSHAVLDHRFRLILFRDLVEMARTYVDWDEVERIVSRWGLRSTTYLALWIAKSQFGAAVPGGFLDGIRPRSMAISYLERALPRADLIRFDGHRAHPINLAAVTLHDSLPRRLALLARAPTAFPGWRRRVAEEEKTRQTPRTLIVVSTDRRRGAEVFTARLREGLTKRGWVVDAIALRGYDEEGSLDIPALVDGDSHPGRFNIRLLRQLRRYIREFDPELVVANGGATLRYTLAASPFGRRDHAYISIGEPNYWIGSVVSRWASRLMLRATDRILAVSSETAEQTIALEPSVAPKVYTTFTGIPDELFSVRRAQSTGPLKVLMIGNLSYEKDPGLAIRAVAGLEDAMLRLVGDGPMRSELENLTSSLGVVDRVQFTGSVRDVADHLVWADVLMLTSRSEGLPGAVLEASAAGLPTVSVDVGGVAEAVINGKTGFVVPRSESDLMSALRSLAENRSLVMSMGAAAKEHAAEHFSMDDIVDRYARVLQGMEP